MIRDIPARIQVEFRPHWVNGWVLRTLSTPVVVVDGHDTPGSWSHPAQVEVTPGIHDVAAGFRYLTMQRVLGTRPRRITLLPGQTSGLLARNGPLNSDPFILTPSPGPL
jgi:hypothetical protein